MLLRNHEREHAMPPQRDPNMGAMALWDPGGRPPGDDIVESKEPVEPMDIAAGTDAPQEIVAPGIVAHKKNPGCAEVESVCQHHHPEEPTTHLYPSIIVPSHRQGVHLLFILRPIERATALSWEIKAESLQQRARLGSVTPASRYRHTRPLRVPAPCKLVHSHNRSSTFNARPHPLNTTLARPVFVWRQFAAVRRLSAK